MVRPSNDKQTTSDAKMMNGVELTPTRLFARDRREPACALCVCAREAVERRLVVAAVFFDEIARVGRAAVLRCFAGVRCFAVLRCVAGVALLRRVDCVTVKLPILVLLE